MGMPTLFEIIATGIVLVICVVTDIRKNIIYPWLCGLLVLVASFEPNKDFGMSILTAAIGFVPMFIIAVLGTALIPFLPVLIKGAEGVDHLVLYYVLFLFNTVL